MAKKVNDAKRYLKEVLKNVSSRIIIIKQQNFYNSVMYFSILFLIDIICLMDLIF